MYFGENINLSTVYLYFIKYIQYFTLLKYLKCPNYISVRILKYSEHMPRKCTNKWHSCDAKEKTLKQGMWDWRMNRCLIGQLARGSCWASLRLWISGCACFQGHSRGKNWGVMCFFKVSIDVFKLESKKLYQAIATRLIHHFGYSRNNDEYQSWRRELWNGTQTRATLWDNLEDNTLSEIGWTQKDNDSSFFIIFKFYFIFLERRRRER